MEKIKTNRVTEWVEIYSEELYSWAAYKVSDNELARDLVQDTFLADHSPGQITIKGLYRK